MTELQGQVPAHGTKDERTPAKRHELRAIRLVRQERLKNLLGDFSEQTGSHFG